MKKTETRKLQLTKSFYFGSLYVLVYIYIHLILSEYITIDLNEHVCAFYMSNVIKV